MSVRKMIQELIGMTFYKTGRGEYFYAWSADQAIKKKPDVPLYLITDYGEEIHVRGTNYSDTNTHVGTWAEQEKGE